MSENPRTSGPAATFGSSFVWWISVGMVIPKNDALHSDRTTLIPMDIPCHGSCFHIITMVNSIKPIPVPNRRAVISSLKMDLQYHGRVIFWI